MYWIVICTAIKLTFYLGFIGCKLIFIFISEWLDTLLSLNSFVSIVNKTSSIRKVRKCLQFLCVLKPFLTYETQCKFLKEGKKYGTNLLMF